ncbi:hypothetical protein [uncultured Sneathiella sp.]|uniref:hypothetical protein n=1 Tax=uncultured Sneathiella sp. TaxID=879315 RepID=UPI0030EE9EBD|tara:strand:- start:10338 stop:12137 length:1800 start_codon:yes stop_codon:yes gene_type:complete
MISSRISIPRWIVGGFFAALVLSSSVVQAQDKPRSLVPPLGQSTTTQQAETAPASNPTLAPPSEKKVIEGTRIDGSVIVQSLGGLDPASIGTLTTASGGLGPEMWNGTAPERVITLLQNLPVSSTSPEMQRLFRRLLLTAAVIPQGTENPTDLIRLRLEKLVEAGLVTDASELVRRMPASGMTPALDRIAVELMLLQGQNDQACRAVEGQQQTSVDGFWAKADIYCNLVTGNTARAELGLNLLDETAGDDALFFALFDRVAGGATPLPETDQELTPLHFAMLKLSRVSPSLSAIENAGHAFLWALAMDEAANVDDRYVAAYESLTMGSVAPDLLRRLINQGAFRNNADERTELAQIATLYREAVGTDADLEKARLIGEIWAAGERDGSYFTASRLSLLLLTNLTPAEYGDKFELDALRLSLLSKSEVEITNWERAVRRGALRGNFEERDAARKQIARADAYMIISGTTGIAKWNAANFDVAVFNHGEDAAQSENVGMYLDILELFAEPVPDKLWADALALGQVPRFGLSNQVIERNLGRAADAGLVGETIALSLAALGEEGPGLASTETLVSVLTALQKIGLTEDARQLALEAAITRNL